MSYFIMMVGVPASGKSTLAKKLAELYHAQIFSSDEYRKKMYNNEADQTHNKEIFAQLYTDMFSSINNGESAIFDATNVTKKDRKKCLSQIQDNPDYKLIKIAYVTYTPLEDCVERDKQRARQVGDSVILKFYNRFEMPEVNEGFDRIIMV